MVEWREGWEEGWEEEWEEEGEEGRADGREEVEMADLFELALEVACC